MSAAEFFSAARTPRMIAMFVVLVVAALVCIRLGVWQFDRAAVRGADTALVEHAEKVAAPPQALEDVLRSGQEFTTDLQARHVEVTGHIEPGERVLLPGREVDGERAVFVVEPLRITVGPDAGAMIALVRGWLPMDQVDLSAGQPEEVTDPDLDAPVGDHRVSGHLAGSEPAVSARDTPPGVIRSLSPAQLTSMWGGPGFSAYLIMSGTDAPGTTPALAQVPPPPIGTDTGMNVRNLFYALEWLVFGGFAIALWVRMVRDQVKADREDELLATAGAER